MSDVNVDHERTAVGARARFMVRGFIRCMGRIGLLLHLRFGVNVSAIVRLNYSSTLPRVMSIYMVVFCPRSQV